MPAEFLFSNFVNTTIASAVAPGDATISVASVTGMPSPAANQQFALVLTDAATDSIREVVYATVVSGSNLTVLRGQEGTSALTWSSGDYVSFDPTAGVFNALLQNLQGVASNGYSSYSAAATLTQTQIGQTVLYTGSSAGTLTLPAANTVPIYESKIVFRNTGSGALTIAPSAGNTVDTTAPTLSTSQSACFISDGSSVWRALWNDAASAPGWNVGDYKITASTTVPSGWLLCYGQAISRTTYSALFAEIGTTYGAGDGSTTFNLPDCRGRAFFGLDNMGGTAASRITTAVAGFNGSSLGASGGDQNLYQHGHVVYDPTHTHLVNDPGHVHSIYTTQSAAQGTPVIAEGGETQYASYFNTAIAYTGLTIKASLTGVQVQTTGLGIAQNVPPAIIANVLIYAGV